MIGIRTLLIGTALVLAGCGGNAGRSELTQSEVHVRQSAAGLGAPAEPRGGWANSLRSSLLNFEVPWGASESDSSNAYINAMFDRRFESQEARYTAMVDDSLRAEVALEAFVVSAREVAREDETRLAALIALMAAGHAEDEDIMISMNRVRTNRMAVDEGLAEARAWERTFTEVRDRAELELPGSAQAAQLSHSVASMGRWANELVTISDRMSTSTGRVAAEFMDTH